MFGPQQTYLSVDKFTSCVLEIRLGFFEKPFFTTVTVVWLSFIVSTWQSRPSATSKKISIGQASEGTPFAKPTTSDSVLEQLVVFCFKEH